MICDNYKGKITYEEAMRYDVGFLQYLWYIGLKTNANKKALEQKKDEAVMDELKGD